MNFNSETIITMHFKNGKKEDFSVYSLSRWLCLVEAFEYITEFAKNHNIKLEDCEFIKKPASLYEYINAKQPKIEDTILGHMRKYSIATDYIFELM